MARRIALALGIATSVSLPLPGLAQSPATVAAREELDRLLPEWRAATTALAEAELTRRRIARATVIERGHIRIIADSAVATQVAEAASVASVSLDRLFGADARLAAGQSIVARLQPPPPKGGVRTPTIRLQRTVRDGAGAVAGDHFRSTGEERAIGVRDAPDTHADLVRALESLAAAPLHAALDDALRFWFRSALPASPETAAEIEDIHVDLATASSDVSRRCLAGEILGCRQVLGLSPLPDPIVQGYTGTERRVLVSGNVEQLRTPGKAAEFDRCVASYDDAACIARLRELAPDRVARRFSSTGARRSFARWALAKGGPGAYTRLRSADTLALDERFAAAARIPVDSLVATWHAHVMSGRPAQPTIPFVTAITTLLWIGACGAVALRSSRWR